MSKESTETTCNSESVSGGLLFDDIKKDKCPKCGCEESSEKETYGPLCPTQKWLVCDACATIIKKISR